MTLKVKMPEGAFKSAIFYDADDNKLDVRGGMKSHSGDHLRSVGFRIKGQFSSKGRIVLDVYEDVKKYKVLFRATGIRLEDYKIALGIDKNTGSLIAKIRDVDFPMMYGKDDDGFNIPLIVRLPTPILELSGGYIERAVSTEGNNYLMESDFWRQIHHSKLRTDLQTAEMDVRIRAPEKDKETIKEISGTLEYHTSEGSRTIDSGMIDFAKGTAIREVGLDIESIDESSLKFNCSVPLESIRSTTFYSTDGTELDIQRTSWGTMEGKQFISFEPDEGKLPSKGRIVFEIAENLKKHKIGFIAKHILIEGDEYKQQKW